MLIFFSETCDVEVFEHHMQDSSDMEMDGGDEGVAKDGRCTDMGVGKGAKGGYHLLRENSSF